MVQVYVNIIEKKHNVRIVKVLVYVNIIEGKQIVKNVLVLVYVITEDVKLDVLYVKVILYVVIINVKVFVEYVLQRIIHFVFIVNIFMVLKDIYLQKIHMKSYVLIVTIIYIQMKKKFLQNIRKNNILFTKNLKKDMVKIISNMT